jgi:hypothetical protein
VALKDVVIGRPPAIEPTIGILVGMIDDMSPRSFQRRAAADAG